MKLQTADRGWFVVYGLRELYHEPGTYEFKIVLDGDVFKNCHESESSFVGASNTKVKYEMNSWGRKMNVSFKLDESIPDGVCAFSFSVKDKKGRNKKGYLSFWTVK